MRFEADAFLIDTLALGDHYVTAESRSQMRQSASWVALFSPQYHPGKVC